MPDLEALAPNYRRAQQRWPNAPTLFQCHDALRACFDANAHGLVEHVKSFIESVCLTIMAEFREPMPSSTPSTTDLLVAALSSLGMRNTRGASKLDKVLSGFNRLADALSEMRDSNGPVAHGKDGFLDSLTADHARAFLHAGDAILGVLLSGLEGREPDLTVTREPYERFVHLNERIDRTVSVDARIEEDGERPIVVFSIASGMRDEAIELRVEPSRLLYGIDRSAYIEVLRTADLSAAEDADGEAEEEADEPAVSVAAPAAEPLDVTGPSAHPISNYTGGLESLRAGIEGFLDAEGVDPTTLLAGSYRIADSLLATAEQNMGLDWRKRERLQARLKVALKRVLVLFDQSPERAEEVAERLVAWLTVQVTGGGSEIPEPPTTSQAAPL